MPVTSERNIEEIPEGKLGRLHVQAIRKSGKLVGHTFTFWCPACALAHTFRVPTWIFNGDFTRPTFSPSMVVRDLSGGAAVVACKLWLQDGYLTYSRESRRHKWGGRHVPLPHLP